MHDNWTVASSQDIRDDPMLVQLAVHYRNYMKYPVGARDTGTDMWYSSEKVAALYWGENSDTLSSNTPVNEEFKISLRPGEGYGWHSDKPKHIHPAFTNSSLSDVVRDFTWETSLDFSKASHLWAVQQVNGSGIPVQNGIVSIDKNTTILLSYGHPFPMTGARIKLNPWDNVSSNTLIRLTITGGIYAEQEKLDIPLYELTSGSDSLSSYIQKFNYPLHDLRIEISVPNSGITDSNAVPLKGISFELYS